MEDMDPANEERPQFVPLELVPAGGAANAAKSAALLNGQEEDAGTVPKQCHAGIKMSQFSNSPKKLTFQSLIDSNRH